MFWEFQRFVYIRCTYARLKRFFLNTKKQYISFVLMVRKNQLFNFSLFFFSEGSHPIGVNSEVERIVCKVGFSGCCEQQYKIKIRNCGLYMAYCLPALNTCPERYCFGKPFFYFFSTFKFYRSSQKSSFRFVVLLFRSHTTIY